VMSDADGSMPPEQLPRLLAPIVACTAEIAIGSRYADGARTDVKQPIYRVLWSRLANLAIQRSLVPGVRDTQCGFKAFTAEVADRVFPVLQTRGFGFDVEVLYRAQRAGYKIVEVPTRWINSPQSRVHPIRHSAAMFLELLAIPDRVRKHPTLAAGANERRESA